MRHTLDFGSPLPPGWIELVDQEPYWDRFTDAASAQPRTAEFHNFPRTRAGVLNRRPGRDPRPTHLGWVLALCGVLATYLMDAGAQRHTSVLPPPLARR